mgnify:CR=1 FL=1
MDKQILVDYIDACKVVDDTKEEIRKLKKNRKRILTDTVKGSSHDFPYTLQRLLKTDRLVDGYSLRTTDGKIIYDDKPNKHYVCKEKVWEYNTADIKYMRQMFKELRAMGLLADDE